MEIIFLGELSSEEKGILNWTWGFKTAQGEKQTA